MGKGLKIALYCVWWGGRLLAGDSGRAREIARSQDFKNILFFRGQLAQKLFFIDIFSRGHFWGGFCRDSKGEKHKKADIWDYIGFKSSPKF